MMRERYDLCLHLGSDLWLVDFYLGVYEVFKNKGKSVLLVSFNTEHADIFISKGFTNYLIFERRQALNMEQLLECVSSLGFPSVQSLYRTEKYFFDVEEAYYIHTVAQYYSFLLEVVERYDIAEFLTYEGDELEHNLFRSFAKMIGGKLSYFGYSNYKINLHFHNDEKRYYTLPHVYRKANFEISIEDKQKIKEYINSYTQKQPKLWGDPKKFDIKFKLVYFKIALRKVVQQLTNRVPDERFSFKTHFKAYFLRLFRRYGAFRYYSNINDLVFEKNPDLYFFPMHVPNDSQLTQRGLPFYNQLNLIEIISSYVPYPAKLIVKEHPNGRGFYRIDDLRKISGLKNVILVPPTMNSHEIIKKSKAIFVINSSVGFESLMYQKPVITFGRSFYRDLGLTIDISSLYDIEDVFNKVKDFNLPYPLVEDFIYKLKKLTYDIDMYSFNESNYRDKIEGFALSIYDYIFDTEKHSIIKPLYAPLKVEGKNN